MACKHGLAVRHLSGSVVFYWPENSIVLKMFVIYSEDRSWEAALKLATADLSATHDPYIIILLLYIRYR